MINRETLDSNLNSSIIVGTCIINDCDPCIKAAVGACIMLCKGGTIIKKTHSNDCGNYKFSDLTPGTYTVTGSCKNLCAVKNCIKISDIPDIYMVHLLFNRKGNCN